ncbi:MAG: hypothetical protein JWR42_746 [Marmoricola sp.]|nr:hypothetical protein [Marmoricola sp.]
MLLGALVDAGVPLGLLAEAVDKVAPGQVRLSQDRTSRGGFAATRCHVEVADDAPHRTWRDVERLLNEAGLHEDVRSLAHDVFSRLAEAEARVHGTEPAEVHFHEVGALDAIADVVGVCAGMVHLDLATLVVSAVAVGGGTARSEHGLLPVPPPAVVELLRGVPSRGGPVDLELCTPTGAALLTALADEWGPQPPMVVAVVGTGAGGRDPEGHANVLRLLLGAPVTLEAAGATPGAQGGALLMETNVDDLDPRLWPPAIAALLAAGASDVWLTPILMKKGRPAHTLSVLVTAARADVVRREVYRQTSTIGLREQLVGKHELAREMDSVEVRGRQVAVKLARLEPGGEVLNAQPEFEDVAAAARSLDVPVKSLMAEAVAAAQRLARRRS